MAPSEPLLARPDSHISHASAIKYWNTQEASVTGMLGGLPEVSKTDLQGSKNFFTKLRRRTALGKRRRGSEEAQKRESEGKEPEDAETHEKKGAFKIERAVDCGAGIGRVTLGFLSHVSAVTDIVEPVAKFTAEIENGESLAELRKDGRVGTIHTIGVEAFHPESKHYDLMWHQWCLSQLTDEELVSYLRRAKQGLKEDGWAVVKENVAGGEEDEFDEQDSSVTRCVGSFKRLFGEGGWKVEVEEVQKGFPRGLFQVRMWGLRPVTEL